METVDARPRKNKKSAAIKPGKAPALKKLLEDPDVAGFFAFVHQADMRERALQLLCDRMKAAKKA